MDRQGRSLIVGRLRAPGRVNAPDRATVLHERLGCELCGLCRFVVGAEPGDDLQAQPAAGGQQNRMKACNAEAGREMYETGNYISPTFNYEPRFQKPALYYWVICVILSFFQGRLETRLGRYVLR